MASESPCKVRVTEGAENRQAKSGLAVRAPGGRSRRKLELGDFATLGNPLEATHAACWFQQELASRGGHADRVVASRDRFDLHAHQHAGPQRIGRLLPGVRRPRRRAHQKQTEDARNSDHDRPPLGLVIATTDGGRRFRPAGCRQHDLPTRSGKRTTFRDHRVSRQPPGRPKLVRTGSQPAASSGPATNSGAGRSRRASYQNLKSSRSKSSTRRWPVARETK